MGKTCVSSFQHQCVFKLTSNTENDVYVVGSPSGVNRYCNKVGQSSEGKTDLKRSERNTQGNHTLL